MSGKKFIKYNGFCVEAVKVFDSILEVPRGARVVSPGTLGTRNGSNLNDIAGTVYHDKGIGYYFVPR